MIYLNHSYLKKNKEQLSNYFSYVMLLSLFLPYLSKFKGLRLDHFILGGLLVLLPLFIVIKGNIRKNIAIYTFLAFFSYLFLFLRIALDSGIDWYTIKLLNQYSYILSSLSLFLLFRFIRTDFLRILIFIFVVSIIVNVFGIVQFFYWDSSFVSTINTYYSGELMFLQKAKLTTLEAALSLRRASSIFVQPSSYGVFNLMIIALALGAAEVFAKSRAKWIVFISLVAGLIGGILSSTKTFYYSVVLLFILYSFLIGKRKPASYLKSLGYAGLSLLCFLLLYPYIPYGVRLVNELYDSGVWYIFSTRYDPQVGILTSSYPVFLNNLVLGVGRNAFDYKYLDSMPFMTTLLSGVVFSVMFYLVVAFVLFRSFKLKKVTKLHSSMFCLNVLFLPLSIGFPIYIQARIIPIYFLLNFYLFFESDRL